MENAKFGLKINEPCHEDWQGMTAEGKGRFCAVCTKVVVDFTTMTDAEIIAYFQKSKEEEIKICGRFKSVQLEKVYEPVGSILDEIPRNSYELATSNWQQFLWLLVVSMGTLFLASCQNNTPKSQTAPGKQTTGLVIQVEDSKAKDSLAQKQKNTPGTINGSNDVEVEVQREVLGEVAEVPVVMGDTIYYKNPEAPAMKCDSKTKTGEVKVVKEPAQSDHRVLMGKPAFQNTKELEEQKKKNQ